MDRFGVQKSTLKAIARTPKLPQYRYDPGKPSDGQQAKRRPMSNWLGAMMVSLQGEEFSAFGVNKEDGGLLIKRIEKSSPLGSAKLQVEDVIQTINGTSVKDRTSLKQAISGLKKGEEIKVGFVRFQVSQTLSFKHP